MLNKVQIAMSTSSDIALPSKAVWVSPVKKGSKSNRILLDPLGFRMHYKKTDYKKKYFHCAHKFDMKCPVKVSLDVSSDMITGWRGEHTHDNELIENDVKKIVREKVSNAAENPSISPRTVMQDITNSVLKSDYSSAGLAYVPNIKTLAKNVQRSRTKVNKHPAIPHNWEDMEIPMEMQETVDKKPFCVMKENIPRSEQLIWGFASVSAMQVMKTSSDWYVDGTFELVNSTLFKQVWVIVCPINNYSTSIPCAFFLLPCKEYTAYKMVMDCISSNDIPSPEKIHLDLEAGAIKAVKDVYPTATLIGCDVHWKRCLRQKLKQLGLLKWTTQFSSRMSKSLSANCGVCRLFHLTRSSQYGRSSSKALLLILTKNKRKILRMKLRLLLTTQHWSSWWCTSSLLGWDRKMLEIQRDQEGRPSLLWVFGTSMITLSMEMTDVTTSPNRGTQ